MQEKTKLGRYELVLLDPDTVKNKKLAGCCMTVVDRHPWGAMGYVKLPEGLAWYRAEWPEMLATGGRSPLQLDVEDP